MFSNLSDTERGKNAVSNYVMKKTKYYLTPDSACCIDLYESGTGKTNAGDQGRLLLDSLYDTWGN